MATLASHREHAASEPRADWTPQKALKYAWYTYLVLLVVPFFYFIYIVATMSDRAAGMTRFASDRWFLGSVAYMVTVVPLSFFLRSRFFRDYWRGECVAPRDYFKGMLAAWVALEIGGLVSLTGCMRTQSLAPCVLPAVVAFMLFVAMWPSGRAMVSRGRGASDDPEKYEEPR